MMPLQTNRTFIRSRFRQHLVEHDVRPFIILLSLILFISELQASKDNQKILVPILSKNLSAKLSQFQNNFILVQVWSPFCEPCSHEVSELNRLLKTRGDIAILGIPIQSRGEEIEAFIRSFKPQYENWLPDAEFQNYFKIHGKAVPWTLLFNKRLELVHECDVEVMIARKLVFVLYDFPDGLTHDATEGLLNHSVITEDIVVFGHVSITGRRSFRESRRFIRPP